MPSIVTGMLKFNPAPLEIDKVDKELVSLNPLIRAGPFCKVPLLIVTLALKSMFEGLAPSKVIKSIDPVPVVKLNVTLAFI